MLNSINEIILENIFHRNENFYRPFSSFVNILFFFLTKNIYNNYFENLFKNYDANKGNCFKNRFFKSFYTKISSKCAGKTKIHFLQKTYLMSEFFEKKFSIDHLKKISPPNVFKTQYIFFCKLFSFDNIFSRKKNMLILRLVFFTTNLKKFSLFPKFFKWYKKGRHTSKKFFLNFRIYFFYLLKFNRILIDGKFRFISLIYLIFESFINFAFLNRKTKKTFYDSVTVYNDIRCFQKSKGSYFSKKNPSGESNFIIICTKKPILERSMILNLKSFNYTLISDKKKIFRNTYCNSFKPFRQKMFIFFIKIFSKTKKNFLSMILIFILVKNYSKIHKKIFKISILAHRYVLKNLIFIIGYSLKNAEALKIYFLKISMHLYNSKFNRDYDRKRFGKKKIINNLKHSSIFMNYLFKNLKLKKLSSDSTAYISNILKCRKCLITFQNIFIHKYRGEVNLENYKKKINMVSNIVFYINFLSTDAKKFIIEKKNVKLSYRAYKNIFCTKKKIMRCIEVSLRGKNAFEFLNHLNLFVQNKCDFKIILNLLKLGFLRKLISSSNFSKFKADTSLEYFFLIRKLNKLSIDKQFVDFSKKILYFLNQIELQMKKKNIKIHNIMEMLGPNRDHIDNLIFFYHKKEEKDCFRVNDLIELVNFSYISRKTNIFGIKKLTDWIRLSDSSENLICIGKRVIKSIIYFRKNCFFFIKLLKKFSKNKKESVSALSYIIFRFMLSLKIVYFKKFLNFLYLRGTVFFNTFLNDFNFRIFENKSDLQRISGHIDLFSRKNNKINFITENLVLSVSLFIKKAKKNFSSKQIVFLNSIEDYFIDKTSVYHTWSNNLYILLLKNIFSKNNSSLLLYFEKTIQNAFLQMHQLLFEYKQFKRLEIFENIKISLELKNIFLRFKKSSEKKINKFLILDFSEISLMKFEKIKVSDYNMI
jgi:hypothetical protein